MKRKKILVVDDSMTNIVLLNSILDDEGYKVLSTINPQEGLNMVENCIPDLVLLDLKMPKITGFDFLEKLYSEEKNKDIPVIVVTAYDEDFYIENSYELGAKDVILKPINSDKLIARIKNIFSS